MANLFHGKTLHWSAYDPSRVIATVVHGVLNDLLPAGTCQHFTLVDAPQAILPNSDLGLAVWRISSLAELSRACAALEIIANRNPHTLRIAYSSDIQVDRVATLVEAGAQIVVSQLPSLQHAIGTCLRKMHVARPSFHPLTSHLLSRLPWPELDDEPTDHPN